jgi:NADPH-dependent ferric siderophore reductase
MTPENSATETASVTERGTAPGTMDASALVARLGDVTQWELEVLENQRLSPSMRRIRCTAPGLADLSYLAGQDVMLSVPTPAGPTFRRRYTIRSFDPVVPAMDIDMVLHGDGPAASWATDVKPGDTIEAIGPRGKITVDPEADWHLFAGDDSALPASLAMAESLPEPAQALVVLEVDGPDDEQTAQAPDGQVVPVRWLHRAGGNPASGDQLVGALAELPLPSGPGHAYLAGELGVVAEMRKTLLARGMAPEQISAKAYWRAGRANAAHGEPERS